MKKPLFILLLATMMVFFSVCLSHSQWVTTQLTDNSYFEYSPLINNNGYVVWRGEDGFDDEIFLYDGTTTIQLTDDFYTESGYQINDNNHVVRCGNDGNDLEIFLYDGTTTIQLTDNSVNDVFPKINNNDYVVWSRSNQIFLYDGTNITQITNTGDNLGAQINDNGHVVWWAYNEIRGSDIFLFDGENITRITDNFYSDYGPQINDNGYVVWTRDDGSDYEIFLYDGTTTIQLTDNSVNDVAPQINNNNYVVWQMGYGEPIDPEIMLYNGTSTTQLTNNSTWDTNPQINNNNYVVWPGYDGSDKVIFLYDGESTTRITDNSYAPSGFTSLQINDNAYVVSIVSDGSDNEILLTVPPPPLVADFTSDVTSGPVPLAVNFTDQSTGDITSWSWDFGNGATSTEQNPAHTYTDSGTYTVSLTVTDPGGTDTETKTDLIVARDASFSSAAAFAVLANMYSDTAMANAVNALDDPSYYPLAALYASSSYDYAEDAYEDATAALAAAQSYTFWGYYAPVYAESDINVRYEAVNSINLAAQYAAQGDLETAEYYLGYGLSLAATADLYNGSTIWCASMEASGQAAAQLSSVSSELEPSANGTSSFSSAATNAVLSNMYFATSVTYGVSALDDPSNIPLVQLYASTAHDYAEAAYNDAATALAAAGQDSTFWGTYAVQYAESDMNNKADALSAFDQAVQAYQSGDLDTAEYYLGYGFLPACSADLYNGTTIWCASMESEGATK